MLSPQNGGDPLSRVLAFLAIVGLIAIFVLGVAMGAVMVYAFML